MPRQSAHQKLELAAFVRGLYRLGGFATWAEFAAAAGFPSTSLSYVQNGVRGIDGYNLYKLIKAAAGRADRDPAAAAREAAPESPMEELAAKVDALAEAVDAIHTILREQADSRSTPGSRPGSSDAAL